MSDKFENLVDEVEETAAAVEATEEVEVTEEIAEEAIEEEVVEETAEEAIEEEVVEETAEEAFEEVSEETDNEDIVDEIGEAVEAVAEGDEDAAEIISELGEDVEQFAEEIIPEETKKKSAAPVIAVVVVLVVLIAGIAAWLGLGKSANKYNDVALSIYGYTLEDMAAQNAMTVEDFKATCGLPEDMPADTNYEAVMYYTPVGKYAELYFGMDFDSFKEQVPVPEQTTVSEPKNIIEKITGIFKPQKTEPITADTPWGAVLDEFKLGDYVMEGQFDSFKEYYGFDDTITTETLYKDVRAMVEQKDYEKYQEQMKAMEEQQQSADTTEGTENAEGENAEAETAEEPVESADAKAEETPAE